MGHLESGQWKSGYFSSREEDGRFRRAASHFRDTISREVGSKFEAAANRYHLYLATACPWCHRTGIVRRLKGLDEVISVSYVETLMLKEGWVFNDAKPDPLFGLDRVADVYLRANPDYTGRVTVPILWDRERDTIVNNESSEIIRMFNTEFTGVGGNDIDIYPERLRGAIDDINERVYHTVNNGVYRSGFASTQAAYDEAVRELFATLDLLEALLGRQAYVAGDVATEADLRLIPTLVRFDAVYHTHFKCNRTMLRQLPNLSNYTRAFYQEPYVRETVNIEDTRAHYFVSHASVNPHRIIPIGARFDLEDAHDRGPIVWDKLKG